jgi:N-methylhydantoinase B/oxoprolinase/acetone carboxylase alpha subunit
VELPNAITAGSDLVLTIFDAQGRVVQQAPLRMHQGTVELDIQAQAKGIYHVELQDGNRRYTGRIVFE